MRIRSLVAAVFSVLCVIGLAGCTPDRNLPTISGGSAGSTELETVAKAYYTCMSNAGIEVELTQNDYGQLSIVNFTGDHLYLWRDATGQGWATMPSSWDPNKDRTPMDVNNYVKTQGAPNELLIDGEDHSDTYKGCLAESGYDTIAAQGVRQWDPEDMELAQQQLNANNEWAACVRANGWPNVQDVALPADPSSGVPGVLIPFTITEDQLRQLLVVCPLGDIRNYAQVDIDFDPRSITSGTQGGTNPETQAMLDKYWALGDILERARPNAQ